MNVVLADSPYNTRSTRGQSNFARDRFSKRDLEDAVRLMGKAMAPAEHGHICCSKLMFHHWNRSLRAAKKNVEVVEGDLKGEKEKVSEILEVEDQALSYIKQSGDYSRDPRRQYLFHASVWEIEIQFWKIGATWNTMLQLVNKKATGDIAYQHPR